MSTLWLVGMMGAGKTTIGRLVGGVLGLPFVDVDAVVEEEAGASVAEIFLVEGEEGFRDLEARAIAAVAGREAVVACGGGAVLDPGNRELMRGSGKVVWLTADTGELARRLSDAIDRPLLAGDDHRERLAEIAAARRDAYAEAAHGTVSTDDKTPEAAAEEVVALWRNC